MTEDTGAGANFYALLIGVDNYLKHTLPGGGYYPKLSGCVADVRRVEAFLKANLDLPDENIYKLTSTYGMSVEPPEPKEQWPTYENMVAAFQEVTELAGEGDQVLIHYSGHGGRTETIYPDLKGAAAYDESLVPMDIGREDARYLRDLELAHIFQTMVDKGVLLTVVLDSCHSGGTTRAMDVVVRGLVGEDNTQRPTDSLVASADELAATWQASSGPQTRALKPGGGWLPQPQGYTLLAACRAQEYAHEYSVAPGKRGGALTWWTLESLKQLGPGLTYRMLHNQVLPKIHSKFPQQTPQLQGGEDRTVFGSETVRPLQSVNVTEVGPEGKRVQLATGQVQAVTKGAQFAVYPEGTENFRQVEQRLALVEIDDLGATSSWAKLVKSFGRGEMALGDRAVLLDPGKIRLRRRVMLVSQEEIPPEIDQDAALAAIRTALETEGSGWVSLGQEGDEMDYQVAVSDLGFYEIWDRAGMPIPNLRPSLFYRDTGAPARVVQRLVHLTKFNNLLLLDNHDRTSPLARALEVEVLKAQPDFEPGEPPDPVPFDDPGNTPVVALDQWLLARIKNLSAETLNVAVFDLASDWSVAQVHPTWTDFLSLGPDEEEIFPLQAGLSEGCEDGIDVLKVFATLGPASFRWLEMPELDQPPSRRSAATRSLGQLSPLEEMLAAFIDDKPLPLTRSLNPAEYPSRGWSIAQVEVHVKKASRG
mgnify:CR=1 FL=1